MEAIDKIDIFMEQMLHSYIRLHGAAPEARYVFRLRQLLDDIKGSVAAPDNILEHQHE